MIEFRRHINALDVFIEVHKLRQYSPKRYTLKVTWWNAGCRSKPWQLTGRTTIYIKADKFREWKPCNELGEIYA